MDCPGMRNFLQGSGGNQGLTEKKKEPWFYHKERKDLKRDGILQATKDFGWGGMNREARADRGLSYGGKKAVRS